MAEINTKKGFGRVQNVPKRVNGMMKKQVILTSDGLAKLEQELEHLKIVKRKEISDQLKVAISFGDLSENSE